MIDENIRNRYEKRLYKAKRLKGSCMNNAKWKKLFIAIHDNDIAYCSFETKAKICGNENNLFTIPLFMENEAYTIDGMSGPIKLSDIEYLVITLRSKDELFRLERLINELGKYEYLIDNETHTIKVYGYK